MEKVQKQIIFLVASFLLLVASSAQAASLYFSPSSDTYNVGESFPVSVYVSSADQAMNAASGIISFPQDKLEVTSLSKSGSIFTFWVQEPVFSNSAGTVTFEGIVLNPGFTGSTGKIITVNFEAKAAGSVPLTFSSGSVLANDGKGTNILVSMGAAAYALAAKIITPLPPGETPTAPTTPTLPTQALAAPVITSSTHPNPDKWYFNNDPEFNWTLPSDVNGVSIYLSKSPSSNPGPASDGLSTSKSYKDIDDGTWYFHIKFRNQQGWGKITHRKVLIDTQPPLPFEIEVQREDPTDPQPILIFETTDELSGIEYYEVKTGEREPLYLNLKTSYKLPPQTPGKHSIEVKAFDKAGNWTVATEEFTIKPLPEPIFTDYPKELESGYELTVKGESKYSNSQIIIWLQKENEEPRSFTIQSDGAGKFVFVSDKGLRDGIYKVWLEVVDGRGARSLPTEKITITVTKPAVFRIGTWAVSLLVIIIPLIALVTFVVFLLFLIWYIWYKFSLMRKRLRKEVREAENALHQAFDLLKEDIQEQIKMLEKTRTKRQLTKEEEKIIKQLKKRFRRCGKIC